MIDLGLNEVLWSATLVLLALGITFWWKIPLQKEIALGSVRAFIQLMAVGYALKYIFDLQSQLLILLAILVMLLVGAQTAASRVEMGRYGFVITLTSITVASVITLGILLALGVITWEARYIIPLAGMTISNSMNAAALTSNRIASDLRHSREAVETSLALGKTWREASLSFQKDAVAAGMIPLLNFLKTVGLVALPGAMTGMILAGVEPVEAILLQIVVAYMLLASMTITSIVALEMTVRRFFTPAHQLKLTR